GRQDDVDFIGIELFHVCRCQQEDAAKGVFLGPW
ncbi:hypothetical protein LCGC14_2070090, partial [marine sediment metagenome]